MTNIQKIINAYKKAISKSDGLNRKELMSYLISKGLNKGICYFCVVNDIEPPSNLLRTGTYIEYTPWIINAYGIDIPGIYTEEDIINRIIESLKFRLNYLYELQKAESSN